MNLFLLQQNIIMKVRKLINHITNTNIHLHFLLGYRKLTNYLVETIKESQNTSVFRLFAYEYISIHLGYYFIQTYFPDLPNVLLRSIVEPTITDQVMRKLNIN